MPWNGKRKVKPLEVSKCCCSECEGICPDPPAQALVRCEACHYGDRHGFGLEGGQGWWCAAAGHRDQPCGDAAEHRRKVAAEHASINRMLRTLDHVLDVASESKWGQTTFEEFVR